jgi:hypothetical protein
VLTPTPPDTATVVANPTISRSINPGSSSPAAPRVLGIRLNPDIRFILIPSLLSGCLWARRNQQNLRLGGVPGLVSTIRCRRPGNIRP